MITPTILVTGSNGQLGSELRALSSLYPQYNFQFFSREELPIDEPETVRRIFDQVHPAYLINCAAYTAVDKAESEIQLAEKINGTAVGSLASICLQQGTRFIHISTDYVFNGSASEPLKETNAVDPVNAYGASKLKGEELAMQQNSESLIIRTSWVYSVYGKNFVKTMIRLMQERPSISVVEDQVGSPTNAADLAETIMLIIGSGKWLPGIYHFSNEGVISWYEFAVEIKNLIGADCQVQPIVTAQYPTPARRPHYSVLDKSKIISAYGIELKNWKESLQRCIAQLKAGSGL
jgi:dTDP-4-dehydrorhamnose reductase